MALSLFEGVTFPHIRRDGLHIYEFPEGYDPQKNWVHQYMSWTRTYKEWIELIDIMRKPLFGDTPQVHILDLPRPPYIPNTIPDAWHHRHIAADQLENCFRRTQWIRWQMRRILMALRRRIMDRRVIGEKDVGTLESIPPRLCVTVYDWRTRSRYQFHANTIHRHISEALRYQTMAMSMPRAPKNPYTNLPWSLGQLMVLYEQMQPCLWNVGRHFLDPAVQAFYISTLDLKRFQAMYGAVLDVECARRFFRDLTSEYWELLYGETLEDMFAFLHPENQIRLKFLLIHRNFSAELLREWDDLVIGFWCYDNLNRVVLTTMCSIYEMIEAARNLLQRTEYLMEQRKAARKKNLRIS